MSASAAGSGQASASRLHAGELEALLIGHAILGTLHGIFLSEVMHFYRRKYDDKRVFKLLVGALLVLQTTFFVNNFMIVYSSFNGSPNGSGVTMRAELAQGLLVFCVAVLSSAFFLHAVWQVNTKTSLRLGSGFIFFVTVIFGLGWTVYQFQLARGADVTVRLRIFQKTGAWVNFALGLYYAITLVSNIYLDPSGGFKSPNATDRLTRVLHYILRTAFAITCLNLSYAVTLQFPNSVKAGNAQITLNMIFSNVCCLSVVYTLNVRRYLRVPGELDEDDPSNWRGDVRMFAMPGDANDLGSVPVRRTWLSWQRMRSAGITKELGNETGRPFAQVTFEPGALECLERLELARMGPRARRREKESGYSGETTSSSSSYGIMLASV